MTFTEAEREVVLRAQSMFQTYSEILNDNSKDPQVIFAEPIRVFQVLLSRYPNRQMSMPQIMSRIVENACLNLLEAIDADAREEMYEALGSVLADVCSICTGHKLDFCEVSRNFDSQFLNASSGEGIVGILNLFKAIGTMAAKSDTTSEAIGIAAIRICAAVHWLAFSNDIDASVMFQEILQRKLAQANLPPSHGGGMSGHDND